MRQSRTHTCGELRLTDAGKTVTIAGWMENLREVGANFAFLVLRDYYGTTQVVIQNEEMMARVKGVNKESTLQVTGIVRERESKNPKQPTGDIEIEPFPFTFCFLPPDLRNLRRGPDLGSHRRRGSDHLRHGRDDPHRNRLALGKLQK